MPTKFLIAWKKIPLETSQCFITTGMYYFYIIKEKFLATFFENFQMHRKVKRIILHITISFI